MDVREILLSKKFIFALTAIIMGFVLVLTKNTTSDIFFEFVKWISGIYVVGNISDKINDTAKEIQEGKNDTEATIADIK